jgi:putative IMPACT (imprinted ancient) family translation regulator
MMVSQAGPPVVPMLEVLRHQKLEGVLASVVRYYGGINLGAGGLVRTYTDAIAQAIKKCNQGSDCSPENFG